MVEVVGIPNSWAVIITSFHWSTVIRPGDIRSRSSWSNISAEVPGRLPTPAAFNPSKYSRMEQRERMDPYNTSSGENPWMWISGNSSLMASHRRMYRSPSICGGSPAWMHTSVAP